MPQDSDTLAPLASAPFTLTQNCRRCETQFECNAVKLGDLTWPAAVFCDPCYDIERARYDDEQAEHYRAKRRTAWRDEIGRDAFTDTDLARLPQKQLAAVLAWRMNPRGLVLHGKSGLGKSRIMYHLAHRLYVTDGVPLLIVRATAAARKITEFHVTPGFTESYISKLTTSPLLIIDDLGKETQSERWESAFVEILDARCSAGRPCIITTNFVGAELVRRYRDESAGDAIVRRLREFCAPVAFHNEKTP